MKQLWLLPILLFATGLYAQDDRPDSLMMRKIREEGMNHSQVMDIAFYLTDANGPRLMQSPGYFRAANWAKKKLVSWGLENVKLEPWGEWGNGWQLDKFYFAMNAPYYKPLIGFPKTMTVGTDGLKNAEAILIDASDSLSLLAWRGKLKGKIVVIARNDSLPLGFAPDAYRFSDEELKKLADFDPKQIVQRPAAPVIDPRTLAAWQATVKAFAKAEGASCILSTSTRNSDGTVYVQNGVAYNALTTVSMNDIAVSYEDYKTIQRLLEHHIPVNLGLELKTSFYSRDQQGYNVIGEIKGTDAKLKDQLVMIGGHLDCWQGSTGATDNAAGSAVMMEVMRILKTIRIQPRRTIRLALWGGEETGLYGSSNYVKNHFMDTLTGKYSEAGNKVSVYFNLDNGSGKIRGIYLQGNDAAKPIFSQWFEPFHDLGATTVTLQNTGGTDFLPFDATGLPAFQFIQDRLEYGSRTHHTNMDSYDHLSGEDLKQAATIIAAFVYDATQRDEKIPRKK